MRRVSHNSNRSGPIASHQLCNDENARDSNGKQELLDGRLLLLFLLRKALLEINWSFNWHWCAKLIVLLAQGGFLCVSFFFLDHADSLCVTSFFKLLIIKFRGEISEV